MVRSRIIDIFLHFLIFLRYTQYADQLSIAFKSLEKSENLTAIIFK